MAQIQSHHGNTLRSVRDQRTSKNLGESAQKKLSSSSNEYECDCLSYSDSEVFHKKIFPKKLSKRFQGSQKNGKKDKHIRTTQSRRKFRTGHNNSYKNVVYSSLCDKPRVLEKSVRTRNTISNQDTTEIKSVEVIKNFPNSCCSALKRNVGNISTKKPGKLQSLKITKLSNKYSESSLSSSSLSPVDQRSSDLSSIDDVIKNQNIKRRKKKLKRFCNCCSCNSLENSLKRLREQTYRRAVTGNRSQESFHRRQGLFPIDIENSQANHKVKNYQIEKFPDESFNTNRKLDKMLKSRKAERSFDSIHEENKIDHDYLMFDKDPERHVYQKQVKSNQKDEYKKFEKSLFNLDEKDSTKVERSVTSNNLNNDHSSDYSSATKSYNQSSNLDKTSPKYWQNFAQDLENISEKYREISSGLKEMRKEVIENEKPKSREVMKEKLIREYPIKDFSFETQTLEDNLNKMEDIKNISKKITIDPLVRIPSEDSQRVTFTVVDEKRDRLLKQESKDQDSTNDLMGLDEELNMKHQEIASTSQTETFSANCQTEYCKCNLQTNLKDPTDESTTPIIRNFSISKESTKEQVKHHDFSLPKIVVPESGERSNVRKMFVYPSEKGGEPPLTVYRTSSFVKCKIKENKHVGYRYILTYVQKYVSPIWKPPDQNNRTVRSQEYVKNDNYG